MPRSKSLCKALWTQLTALNQQMPKCHSILVWLTTPKISVCKMLQKTLDLI